jgi:Xaa-Pro dipeptidase
MSGNRAFPDEEFAARLEAVREHMARRELDACLLAAPENVYYLTGLDHMGYFAYEMLIVPLEGEPVLITRAMEQATVRDQVPGVRHVGYSDGVPPLPAPRDPAEDIHLAGQDEEGNPYGLRPWEMSAGVAVRGPIADHADPAVRATVDALCDAGLERARLGLEESCSFLPYRIARRLVESLPDARWEDSSGLVDDCRLVQSPLELEYTRQAAAVSDSMLLAAIAAAGPGVWERDVMAAIYDALFRRGGTYPGFVPLVRSTRTLEHEHGTWQAGKLEEGDLLFLEMAGCLRRYHAPVGRLVFIGSSPPDAEAIAEICRHAQDAAAARLAPGVTADQVYRAWQEVVDGAGLARYRRHHCGYAVGIGFPPSWSGGGVPRGLRAGSSLELREGMVFHLMSWLLRTGEGDSFLSDTVVVTADGCERLTTVQRTVTVR